MLLGACSTGGAAFSATTTGGAAGAFSTATASVRSRAGAVALAAPPVEGAALGAENKFMAGCDSGCATGFFGSSASSSSRSSSCAGDTVLATAAGAGQAGVGFTTGVDVGSVVSGVATGAAAFISGTAEATGFTGAVTAGGAGGVVGLAGSPLRNRPRATRKVPLDCSIFMGLVRTRLAPMRNAFATPA